MKIHGNTPVIPADAAEQLAKATQIEAASRNKSAGQAKADGDQLTLSPEARAMQTLAAQTDAAPEIRQDVVARMRSLMDQGKLGDDPARLADSMIEDLLK